MILSRLLTGAAVAALMAQPALAQSPSTQQPPAAAGGSQQLAPQDMEFASKAAGDGMAEVELGKLAQQQAASDQIRQFAKRMVDDHSATGDQLESIAGQKGIDLPQALPDEAQKLHDELQQKSGPEFDQAYMAAMVEDHRKAVELFEQEAKSGADGELVGFAEETLPTLQEHLDLAQQTRDQAVAAGEPPVEQPAAGTATAGGGDTPPTAGQAVQASDVIGAGVVNEKGDEVGEIKDLVIDADRVEYAVVSVGGFLGIGDKEVAVPLDQLKLGIGESYLMSGETEAQLKEMPEYQEERFQPRG
jgi:putative membrane protein